MPASRQYREAARDHGSDRGGRQATRSGGARAPRYSMRLLPKRQDENAAATMPASPIGRISSAAGQARSLLAPSSGVTSPATARLRPSMSAKAEEYPAAFCEPHRSTFTLVPAEDGVEDVDI